MGYAIAFFTVIFCLGIALFTCGLVHRVCVTTWYVYCLRKHMHCISVKAVSIYYRFPDPSGSLVSMFLMVAVLHTSSSGCVVWEFRYNTYWKLHSLCSATFSLLPCVIVFSLIFSLIALYYMNAISNDKYGTAAPTPSTAATPAGKRKRH